MDLREYLIRVATSYDQSAGFKNEAGDLLPAQQLLKDAPDHLTVHVPIGYRIQGSGGQYPLNATHTPWIGFFDPDETTRATRGLYVVFLLRPDRSAWTLSVNMGVTHLKAEEISRLRTTIRDRINSESLVQWDDAIDLQSRSGSIRRKYELGAVAGRTYPVPGLPGEATLRADLLEALRLYERAVIAKRAAAISDPSLPALPGSYRNSEDVDYEWAPGTDKPTRVHILGGDQTRTPRHETGLAAYGEWLQGHGKEPATNVHPRDFVIPSDDVLGEYKVVYGGNFTKATREAHSQLKEYAFFLHDSSPAMVAVFSERIPDARARWLASEGILSVWHEDDTWRGTADAVARGLAE